ncbi:hypothetical protein EDD16DRAFT_1516266 [Pisolithus croceorrhizus]|nr:hypothetical protein EDD16DRAFT_1516266 [Pisolithus croceorrhizus]KAI6156435.1 hypothetical protein EDD17DRAFT_1512359 [Pisolithus thermaeus]
MVSMSAFDTKLPSVPPYAPPSGPYRCFDAFIIRECTSTTHIVPGAGVSQSQAASYRAPTFRLEPIAFGTCTNYRKVGGSCYVSCEIQWRRQALKLSVIKAPMYKLNGRIMGAKLCQSDLRMCHMREETGGSSGPEMVFGRAAQCTPTTPYMDKHLGRQSTASAKLTWCPEPVTKQLPLPCESWQDRCYLESVPTRSVFIDAFGASESNGFIAAVVLLAVGWVVAYPSGNGLVTPPLLLATADCRGYPVQLELKLSHLRLYDGILGQEF